MDYVTVNVVCSHPGRGGGDPETVFSYSFDPGRESEPRGFLNGGGYVFVDGVKVEEGDRHRISAVLRAARETGHLPHVVHQLWCPCGHTARKSESDLRDILERAAGVGVSVVELADFNR